MSNMLNDAIALMKAGNVTEAHPILASIIQTDPHNILAWLWDVEAMPTLESKIQLLERCLQHNPGDQQVTRALSKLKAQLPHTPATPHPTPNTHQPPPPKTSDFITLQCPSCGGKLAVGANILSLRCEYCGTEHMIRREAGGVIIESYARCPVCNRNDRAEKVTAILNSQTHNTEGITYQDQTIVVTEGKSTKTTHQQVAVPVKTFQTSELARRLDPPPQPTPESLNLPKLPSTNLMSEWKILGCIFLFSLSFLVLLFSCIYGELAMYVGLVTAFTIGIPVLIWTKPSRHKVKAHHAKQQELQAYLEKEQREWEAAMKRWNELYYCGRDDCVFLHGTNTYAPIGNMREYLYKP